MTERSIQTLTTFGFNQIFEETLRDLQVPQMKAYEIAEQRHENTFGARRFSSYTSFSRARQSLRTK